MNTAVELCIMTFIICGCGLVSVLAKSAQLRVDEDAEIPRPVDSIEDYASSTKTAKYVRFFKPSLQYNRSMTPSPATMKTGFESDENEQGS